MNNRDKIFSERLSSSAQHILRPFHCLRNWSQKDYRNNFQALKV